MITSKTHRARHTYTHNLSADIIHVPIFVSKQRRVKQLTSCFQQTNLLFSVFFDKL